MQKNTEILNELKELSPRLAAMEKVNVFTVPQGYFDVLSNDILVAVKEQFPGAIKTDLSEMVNDVPEGYFDTLADKILNKIKMQEQSESAAAELRALSPMLYSIQGENVFEVPHSYFKNLPADTLNIINDVTVTEELKIMSPMLYGIQNKNVFEVPQGYFENLPKTIVSKVIPQPAKVVIMGKRSNSFMKYAAAAVFAGMVTLGVFKFTGNSSSEKPQQLAATEKSIIDTGKDIAEKKTFDQELAMLSDADIVSYLQTNGENLDINTIANNIDEKDLPTQNDYLTDEKTLDNYLNGITADDLKKL